MAYFFLVLWLGISLAASYLAARMWSGMLGKAYGWFLYPGIIVHELSHAAGCLMTGATVTKLSISENEGGRCEHTAPRIPVLGQVIVGMAPIIGGAAVLYLICVLLSPEALSGVPLLPGSLTFSPSGFGQFAREALEPVWKVANYLISAQFSHFGTYVFIYLLFAVATAWGPSKKDWSNSAKGIVFLLLLMLAAHFVARGLGKAGELQSVITRPVMPILSFSFAVEILICIVTLCIWVIYRVMRAIFGKSKAKGEGEGKKKGSDR